MPFGCVFGGIYSPYLLIAISGIKLTIEFGAQCWYPIALTAKGELMSRNSVPSVYAIIKLAAKMEGKYSKSEAKYKTRSMFDDKQCRHCRSFNNPVSCDIVVGTISPSGWCKYFVRAK